MADPAPSNPSWSPAPPAPPGWSPVVSTAMPTPPASSNFTPPGTAPTYVHVPFWQHLATLVRYSRWLKIAGLGAVVLGLLLVVSFASYPGSCYTSTANCGVTGSNWGAGALNGIIAGEILLVLGFAAMAVGAFFKLRSLEFPTSGRREELDFVLADRRWNGQLILWNLALLFATFLLVVLLAHTSGIP